jgi:hypothetical protein
MNANKKRKQDEAIMRESTRSKRSPLQQLKRLDGMFGKDKGAKKERAKLTALIIEQVNKKKNNTSSKKKNAKQKK